ncbi:hypothetical protein [Thalassotalea litorea]|uniref:hypothetical protein n=1 Tax=Thalassotalea litorea TaxID=2020715 RepID=UPI003734F225
MQEKNGKLFVFGALFFTLSACSSSPSVSDIEPQISTQLKYNAIELFPTRPSFAIKDQAYDQSLGSFKISNSDISGKYGNAMRTGYGTKVDILEWLIEDDLIFEVEHFNKKQWQRFSFDLNKQQQAPSHNTRSECEVYAETHAEVKIVKEETIPSSPRNYEHARINTFLLCQIKSQQGIWTLKLSAPKKGEWDISLFNDVTQIKGMSIDKAVAYKNGQPVVLPSWLGSRSGIGFYNDNTQITALSLKDDSRVWLQRDLDSEIESVLLAANYSLIMLNWLDDQWIGIDKSFNDLLQLNQDGYYGSHDD